MGYVYSSSRQRWGGYRLVWEDFGYNSRVDIVHDEKRYRLGRKPFLKVRDRITERWENDSSRVELDREYRRMPPDRHFILKNKPKKRKT